MAPAPQKRLKGGHADQQKPRKEITDPRFRRIQTDPRFSLPSRKNSHVKLDDRFSRMLKDEDFYKKASVDRYGRRLPKEKGKKELERLYRLGHDRQVADDDEVDGDDIVRSELERVEKAYDPAREGGFSESSSSESEAEDLSSSGESEDEGLEQVVPGNEAAGVDLSIKDPVPMGEVSSRLAVVNLDWDNIRAVDLMAVASSFCPPDGRIFKVSVYPSEFGKDRMEREEMEGPPKELFSSKQNKSSGQRYRKSSEESEDASESASEASLDDETIRKRLVQEGDSSEFDPHALRSYQISRLRYYYAILTTSSTSTAQALYNAMDGREYLSSANFFDLRFVPDDISFPESSDPIVPKTDRARDECDKVPEGYEPNEFVTDALTHSKVRLTWDEEDRSRKEAQKRAFSRREIDENDMKAYIGSSSSDDEDREEEEPQKISGNGETKDPALLSKADLARHKMRLALGLPVESNPSTTSSSVKEKTKKKAAATQGDLQITFSAALSDPKKGQTQADSTKSRTSVFINSPADVLEESTRDRYIRKEKERKTRRRAKAKAARDGVEPPPSPQPDPTPAAPTASKPTQGTADDDDDPFANDPFFANPAATNAALARAARTRKNRDAADAEAKTAAQRQKDKAELELLMLEEHRGDGDGDGSAAGGNASGHFDMREIVRAQKAEKKMREKQRGKKGRRRLVEAEGEGAMVDSAGAGTGAGAGVGAGGIDIVDPRFAGRLYGSHEFAVDPTNPRFSGTEGMKAVLEEARRRRRKGMRGAEAGDDSFGDEEAFSRKDKKRKVTADGYEGVDALLKRMKGREAVAG